MTEPSQPVTPGDSVDVDGARSFGLRLRRLREAAGLSQTALAGDHIHPSYVSLLESGRRVPTADVVAALAARLGVTPGELAGDDGRELETPVALAEAAVGLGRPAEALALLTPLRDGVSVERCAADPLVFRLASCLATALENEGHLDDAVEVLEMLRAAADTSRGRLPWLAVSVALVRCYRDSGDLGRAIDLGEDAVRRCQGILTPALDGHAKLVSTLAGAYAERGDLLRAQILLDELLEQTSQDGSLLDQAAAYWNSAINAAERGHPVEALRLCEQAATLVSLSDDMRSRARLQVTRAWILLAQTPPQPDEARTLLRDVLPLIRQYASGTTLASAETELARCELLLGRPDVARRHAQAAAKRLTPEQPIELARAHTALGAAYVALGEQSLGIASLEEATELLSGAEAARQSAAVWRQLSAVFREMGDLDRALDAADRALAGAGLLAEPLSPPASSRNVNAAARTHPEVTTVRRASRGSA